MHSKANIYIYIYHAELTMTTCMYIYRDWAVIVDANASHIYFISQAMYVYLQRLGSDS